MPTPDLSPTTKAHDNFSKPDVILDPPEHFDANVLAKSTIRALELLSPWCELSNAVALWFAKDIVKQAFKYVEAIDSSVVAAQKAYTVAEEAISLAEFIPTSTPDEHQRYLVGMLKLAKNGHDAAVETRDTFKDVRADILALLKTVKLQSGLEELVLKRITKTKTSGALRDELLQGINDLEGFAKNMGTFATWWSWIKMDPGFQYETINAIKVNYDSLREEAVVEKWKKVQLQFADYSNQIGYIQDCYPALFVRSRNTKETGQIFGGMCPCIIL